MLQDKRTIGDNSNPANINPIQKIWNHIKYRKGYGTPDFQEGFLGISTMGWFWHQHRIHRIVDIFKWKYRAIKARAKTLYACAQSWKIPKVIEQFQDAMYQAEREQREHLDTIDNLEGRVDRAIEQIIEERWDSCRLNSIIEEHWVNSDIKFKDGADNTKYFKLRSAKFLDESHKDYESDLESIRDLFEEWGLRIPNQWLPEDEAEDRMWDEFDQSRCDAADLGPYDFDCFRSDIDKSFYDSSKVWNEETLPRLEREKKWRADNDC